MNCGEQGSNSIQRKKKNLSRDFLSIRCERGDFAAKDMRCSDRQSYYVWPDSIFSICSGPVRVDNAWNFSVVLCS